MKYIAEDKDDFHSMLREMASRVYDDTTYPDVVTPDGETTIRNEDFLDFCRNVDIHDFADSDALYESFVDCCYENSREEIFKRS